MPDLKKHHSVMANVLHNNTDLYASLRDRKTQNGVGLAQCIKTGIDNRGHPMIKTLGIVAADEECYDAFQELFDEVLRVRHGSSCLNRPHVSNLDRGNLSALRADATGQYVIASQVRVARDLSGAPFLPAVSFEQRREVEATLATALLSMGGPLAGEYFPLAGSFSFAGKPGGLTPEQEEELHQAKLLFRPPDSTAALSTGVGRHWPDARGVFVSHSRHFSAWINEEEHLRVISMRPGDAVQEAFCEAYDALSKIEASLRGSSTDRFSRFARSDRLGFLTSCPSNVGTAMSVSVVLRLPLLSSIDGLGKWCMSLGITVRAAVDDSGVQLAGVVEVSSRDRLGIGEIDTVNMIVKAVRSLIRMERYLERSTVSDPNLDSIAAIAASDEVDEEVASVNAAFCERSRCERVEGQMDAGRLSAMSVKSVGTCDGVPEWSTTGDILGCIFSDALVAMPSSDGAFVAKDANQVPDVQDSLVTNRPSCGECPRSSTPEFGNGIDEKVLQLSDELLPTLKRLLRDQLNESVDTGVLDHALQDFSFWCCGTSAAAEAHRRIDSSRQHVVLTDVDALRDKTRTMLSAALANGTLDGTLGVCNLLDPADANSAAASDLDLAATIRKNMKKTLLASLENGNLQKAFDDCSKLVEMHGEGSGAAARSGDDVATIRQGLRQALEESLMSGALDRAFGSMARSRPPVPPEKSSEELRRQMRDLFLTGLDCGLLGDALETLVKDSSVPLKDRSDVSVTRDKLRIALESGLANGLLADAFNACASVTSSDEGLAACTAVRRRLRSALEVGLKEGSLQMAFDKIQPACLDKEQCPSDIGSIREKMKMTLEAGLCNGSLAAVFDELSKKVIPKAGDVMDIDAIRQKMKSSLEAALDDGTLVSAFGELAPKRDHENDVPISLEAIREKMKTTLESGLRTGALETAFGELACTHPSSTEPSQDLHSIREKMKLTLEGALFDGSLQTAFCRLNGTANALDVDPSPSLNALRDRVKATLESGLQSGALETAFGLLSASRTSETEPLTDLDTIRDKMKGLLVDGLRSGALESALGEMSVPSSRTAEPQAPPSVDAIRLKLREAFESGLESGALETSFDDMMTSRNGNQALIANLDAIREKMKATLEAGMRDGGLDNAFQQMSSARSLPLDVDIIRATMRSALERGLQSGALETALEDTVKKASENLDLRDERLEKRLPEGCIDQSSEFMEVEVICSRMQDALETALEDGSLERYLGTVTLSAAGRQQEDATHITAEASAAMMGSEEATPSEAAVAAALAAADAVVTSAERSVAVEVFSPRFGAGSSCEPETFGDLRGGRPSSAGGSVGRADGAGAGGASANGTGVQPNNGDACAGSIGAPARPHNVIEVAVQKHVGSQGSVGTNVPPTVALLVEMLGNRERRIGALMATITQTEERLVEAESRARQLEDELAGARDVSARLDAELLSFGQPFHDSCGGSEAMDDVCLKMGQHASDVQQPLLMSTWRSELSTACTMRDVQTPSTPTRASPV
eukprot:TRINITY_DN3178_c0_g3_i1.p1 TRINITY_DN3178_c0_g3~~TRINITY_DN3178_c0_g3_i1.p1  ORF type:complete len:1549 (+),score=230.12 TRINITY_DN3178_c0_g3_i1:132-4649(+)